MPEPQLTASSSSDEEHSTHGSELLADVGDWIAKNRDTITPNKLIYIIKEAMLVTNVHSPELDKWEQIKNWVVEKKEMIDSKEVEQWGNVLLWIDDAVERSQKLADKDSWNGENSIFTSYSKMLGTDAAQWIRENNNEDLLLVVDRLIRASRGWTEKTFWRKSTQGWAETILQWRIAQDWVREKKVGIAASVDGQKLLRKWELAELTIESACKWSSTMKKEAQKKEIRKDQEDEKTERRNATPLGIRLQLLELSFNKGIVELFDVEPEMGKFFDQDFFLKENDQLTIDLYCESILNRCANRLLSEENAGNQIRENINEICDYFQIPRGTGYHTDFLRAETHHEGATPAIIHFQTQNKLKLLYKPRSAQIDAAVIEAFSELKSLTNFPLPTYNILNLGKRGKNFSIWEFIEGEKYGGSIKNSSIFDQTVGTERKNLVQQTKYLSAMKIAGLHHENFIKRMNPDGSFTPFPIDLE